MTLPRHRLGLTIPVSGIPLDELGPLVRRAEAAGYDDLWSEEATGTDGITPLAAAATWTERMRLVTGIVSPQLRGRALLAQTSVALAELSGGRFVLGLGSSSRPIVEHFNGSTLGKPLEVMRESITYLRAAFAGERVEGGFRLERPPAASIPIMVAALRGKMLELAAELGDGAFTNFLPSSGVQQVVEAFGRPDKELACRCFCFLGPEDEAVAKASRLLAAYGSVPGYAKFFRWLGWGERIDPMVEAWDAGDRKRALELVPPELVKEIFFTGPPEAHRERLGAMQQAGIGTPVLAFYGTPDQVEEAIDALAP